eukprot:gene24993-30473_t
MESNFCTLRMLLFLTLASSKGTSAARLPGQKDETVLAFGLPRENAEGQQGADSTIYISDANAATTGTSAGANMNEGGLPYSISNPPGSSPGWKGTPGVYSTDFNSNVAGKVDHFDVYGEVRTKYSQVYWTRNTPINLPPELVERFKGKVMAITGYEVDQVTHSGPMVGSTTVGDVLGGFSCYPDCADSDKSVPIYHAYNHHYFGWLTGADAEMVELEETTRAPNPTRTAFRDAPGKRHKFPTSIVFKENPGGEYRKSYHGYPSGFAQLLHSPSQWVVEPMQIDTHNREYDLDDPVGYQPSFLPKRDTNASQHAQLHNGLSPLIECPCSDRITRSLKTTSEIRVQGTCGAAQIMTEAECQAAVAAVAEVNSTRVVANASLPSGCIMFPDKGAATVAAVLNSAQSAHGCSQGRGQFTWQGPVGGSRIDCADGGCLAPDLKYGCTGEFGGQCTWDGPESAQAGCGKYDDCGGFFCGTSVIPGKEPLLVHWTLSRAVSRAVGP